MIKKILVGKLIRKIFSQKVRKKIGIVGEKILGWKISVKTYSPKIYRKNLRCTYTRCDQKVR